MKNTLKRRVLIVDEMHESIIPLLSSLGWEADYQPNISKDAVLSVISKYEGLIVRSKLQVDAYLIEKATNLQFVGRAGAGFDNVDDKLLAQKGIHLFTAGEGNRDAVAEHAVGMLLMLLNKLHLADQQVRQYIWNREANRGIELKGKTVGIIGYGNIGRAFAERLLGFGCHVLAYDKHKSGYGDIFAQEASQTQIFENADILSLHVPLNAENKNYFDETYFNSFKKPIILINTARGELIKFSTIQKMLNSGKWRGAALDVLENEKLNTLSDEQKRLFDDITQRDNIVFSPHVAGWTVESYQKINEVLADKIAKNLI